MEHQYTIRRTATFNNWLKSVKDMNAKAAILRRIKRTRDGNFGDHKAVGNGGISEMRIDIGKGYRIYYTIRGNTIVFLLDGSDKKTQQVTIKHAEKLAKEV